ncbi:outer membrane lipoprotein chaperone LolA [Methylotenera sp. N17]|uniref:outer membrane lipoprotein chaperone LolA n=1 Tax=Methylotenera sp. N17 TaxID=1502761 RepID=UPI000645A902|nr:outer membrane lipoprotein chaperone LolA [Methylotenera sp. N17]
MNLSKYVLTATLWLAATSAGMAYADGVSSLKDFFLNTQSMRAEFKQEVVDKQGRKVQKVEGTMQLQRPNKFRWDYQKPYEQQIISDGKQVFLYDVDLQQVTVRDLSKTLGSSPAAMLAGGEAVEKSFTLKNAVRKDDLTWVLALPKDKESGFDRVLLGFKEGQLKKMELYDSFSHVTHIAFNQIERNPALTTQTFLFTTPKGVDVVGE